ncbi:hypothetical protein D9619_003810 [Psilocybe cf. subviscida]|uniref:F-box domain-containing protein n=1 Tax=Psilocybe cf. subviscida TaxID=2480587 RepID=A0A8H5AXU8_9AGAR|nr:hypothetical protein D9619_003810 [Psilocybe cf. subviscida]
MFHPELPAELALLILSHLPLSSIGYLRRVNRDWAYFVGQNSTTVYRNAAFLEGFIGKNQTLLSELQVAPTDSRTGSSRRARGGQGRVGYESEEVLYSQKALDGVDSWETLCKRQKLIHRSWSGHASSRVISSPRTLPSPLSLNTPENSHYRRVHRIKVDEQVGITLATTELGGLVVRDIETDEVLWELPIWYVHSHAHLEYERGYIIFDRTDGTKEVWRRTQDVEADEARRKSRQSSSSESQSQDGVATVPFFTGASHGLKPDEEGDEEEEELPSPKPDQRQMHVASYLNTLALAFAAAAASPPASTPTFSTILTSPSTSFHPAPSSSFIPSIYSPQSRNSNSRSSNSRTSKAHFTPFTVLTLPALESSRAFRFVYPHLLVVAVDRAYVFDVPQRRVVQVVEDVQRVRRVRVPEEEASGAQSPKKDAEEGDVAAGTPTNAGSRVPSNSEEEGALGGSGDPSGDDGHSDQEASENEEDEDDDEDEDPDSSLAQFLGQIRYVEISPRHIFIAGRHVLRVFSRETGKCVLNMSSTRERYGAWKWDVGGSLQGAGGTDPGIRSGAQAAMTAEGRDKGKQKAVVAGKGKEPLDNYDAARVEGRQAVRVRPRFTFQGEMPAGDDDRMVIDQFVAVHVSRDGKHFVALLSGARLIVVHHFEALLARHRVPPRTVRRHPPIYPAVRNAYRELQTMDRALDKVFQQVAQRVRDKDLFMHTMDIRLGSPRVTGSVYLAYEHGRIGVVTSNAVYIVMPTPPPPPASLSSLRQKIVGSASPQVTYPYPPPPPLSITRLPYFVNPSWLGAVTCLMMSDTGLYLNWNPTSPVSNPRQNRDGFGFGSALGALSGAAALGGGAPHFGMADQADEDEDEDEEMDDEEEIDEAEWMDAGDDWEEADGDGEGELEGDWGQHDSEIDDDAQDTADFAAEGGSHETEDGELAHHLENATGNTTNGHLTVELPSEQGPDFVYRRTHAADEDKSKTGRDEEYRSIWEAEYQRDLRDMNACEDDWYQALPNGDMFVAPNPRPIEVSEVSTVFAIEFVPKL